MTLRMETDSSMLLEWRRQSVETLHESSLHLSGEILRRHTREDGNTTSAVERLLWGHYISVERFLRRCARGDGSTSGVCHTSLGLTPSQWTCIFCDAPEEMVTPHRGES
jgi:hypothetical protein